MDTYYRYTRNCEEDACHCHALGDTINRERADVPQGCECGCTWGDEPPGAGRDPYDRPSPRTHPEYWTE